MATPNAGFVRYAKKRKPSPGIRISRDAYGQQIGRFINNVYNRRHIHSAQGTTTYVNTNYEVTGPSQMVVPTSTLPPTYTHKLYLPVVACAGCNGIPSLNEPLLNLAAARVTYRFNGQQVAVREGVTLTFVYGDHLGSASVTASISDTKVSEVRYYPYGERHYSSESLPSDRTFIGQRSDHGQSIRNA